MQAERNPSRQRLTVLLEQSQSAYEDLRTRHTQQARKLRELRGEIKRMKGRDAGEAGSLTETYIVQLQEHIQQQHEELEILRAANKPPTADLPPRNGAVDGQ